MEMRLKQRIFSWFDSYDVTDEQGQPLFCVKGQPAWGHLLKIYDPAGRELGVVKEKLLRLLPTFELYAGGQYLGKIQREFTLMRPKYRVECGGWQVQGDFLGWEYRVTDPAGQNVAVISKELLHLSDTYAISVPNPADALCALMLVLAIDADKCTDRSVNVDRKNHSIGISFGKH